MRRCFLLFLAVLFLSEVKFAANGYPACTDPPPAPSSISYPSSDAEGIFSVSWPSVRDAEGYELQRDTSAAFGNPVQVYLGTGTVFNESGLQGGNYYYRVRAGNSCGASDWQVGKGAICIYPKAPDNITLSIISDIDGILSVSWPSVIGAITYILERDISSDFLQPTQIYLGAGNAFQDNIGNEACGFRYYYRVKASNTCGSSSWKESSVCFGIYPNLTALTIQETDSDGSFWVNWSSASCVQGFNLYREDSPGSGSLISIYQGTAHSYFQEDLGPGRWEYQLRSFNCKGVSASSYQYITVCKSPPAPSDVSISEAEEGIVSITWQKVDAATRYQVEKNVGGIGYSQIYDGEATTVDTDVEPGINYGFRVKAYNCSEYTDSPWTYNEGNCLNPIPAFTGYPFYDSDGRFDIQWAPLANVSSYVLEQAAEPDFSDATQVYSGTNTSFSTNIVIPGSYYFRVKVNSACGESPWTEGEKICVFSSPFIPPVPSELLYPETDEDGSFTVNWTSVPEAMYYALERSTMPEFSDSVEVYAGSQNSFVETKLESGTYYYRIRSANCNGESTWLSGNAMIVVQKKTSIISIPLLLLE